MPRAARVLGETLLPEMWLVWANTLYATYAYVSFARVRPFLRCLCRVVRAR